MLDNMTKKLPGMNPNNISRIAPGTVIIGCIRDFMRSEAGAPWRERIGMTEQDLFTVGLCIGHIEKLSNRCRIH